MARNSTSRSTTVHLRIEPDLCGPISVGTAGIVLLLRDVLELSLDQAFEYANRCIFENETVTIPARSPETARDFVQRVRALRSPAKFHVRIERVVQPR